ncbi:hypothetical protein E2562_038078 [Oryza meyeriana var. granulata]|uniref:Uncharacterized protein n=1 Tax=Oryza meyeriana var. granulata TaxID=110450 RepID=A0A6G1DAZ1_9ORYZ|nr:hypothetical protein E2562_038078 [Oryza meyeriana var. granulata]
MDELAVAWIHPPVPCTSPRSIHRHHGLDQGRLDPPASAVDELLWIRPLLPSSLQSRVVAFLHRCQIRLHRHRSASSCYRLPPHPFTHPPFPPMCQIRLLLHRRMSANSRRILSHI